LAGDGCLEKTGCDSIISTSSYSSIRLRLAGGLITSSSDDWSPGS